MSCCTPDNNCQITFDNCLTYAVYIDPFLDSPGPIIDTLIVYDTIDFFDTITVVEPLFDTIQVFDTIEIYDTLFIFDTLKITEIVYDTIQLLDTTKVATFREELAEDEIIIINYNDKLVINKLVDDIKVYGLSGELLFNSTSKSEISIEFLNPGIYIFIGTINNKIIRFKFFKY